MSMQNMMEDEKREAIVSHLDKSIFIEAGAGAGKTSLVIERVISLLKGGVLPENIVVITFTNKATEELVRRVHNKVSDLCAKDASKNLSEEEKERLSNALLNLSRMHISTIHGFCTRLLRENALRAKLPMEQSVMEEAANETERNRLFEAWFKHGMKQDLLDELLIVFENVYSAKYEIKAMHTQVLSRCNEDVDIVESDIDTSVDFKSEAKKVFGELYTCIFREVQRRLDYNRKDLAADKLIYSDVGKIFHKCYEINDGVMEYTCTIRQLADLYKAISKKEGIISKRPGLKTKDPKKEKIGDVVEEINFTILSTTEWVNVETLVAKYIRTKAMIVLNAVKQCREYYFIQRNKSRLTNDMLLERTRDLLKNNPELTKQIAKQFQHVFVDEFQDVDHFQAELAMYFYQAGSCVFIVGDPKQSIYRFRGAEPKLYGAVKEHMEKALDAEVYELNRNYRSNANILKWVNDTYRDRFYDPKYHDMEPNPAKATIKTPEKNVLRGVYAMDESYEDVEGEFLGIARLIKAMTNGKIKTDCGPVTYKDIMILTWKTTQFPKLEEALRYAKIPYSVSGNIPLAQYQVLDRYRLLYRYLAKDGDRNLRMEGAYESLVQKACTNPSEREKAKLILDQWDEETKGMDGRQLAGFLLKRIPMLLPKDMEMADNDLVSVRRKLYQMVERITVEDDAASPSCFYHRIASYVSGKQEYDISLNEDTNAVRIMNMHKCKGLEAKIVILADRCSMNPPEAEDYIKTKDENEDLTKREIQDWEYDYYIKDMMPATIEEEGKEEDEAEKLRQLYVITTRAEEAMIFMPFTQKKMGGQVDYMQNVDSQVSEDKGISNVTTVLNSIPRVEDLKSNTSNIRKFDKKQVEVSVSKEQILPCLISLTPSGLEYEEKNKKNEDDVAGVKVAETEENPAEENSVEEPKPEESRPYGNIFGTVMHRAFELLMDYMMSPEYDHVRKAKKVDAKVTDLIPRIITCAITENMEDIRHRYEENWEAEVASFRKYLKEVLENFTENEHILELLSQTKRYETEYEFSYYTDKKELDKDYVALAPYLEKKKIAIDDSQKVYVNGSVDLMLFTEDDRLHIIDYKSDSKGNMTDEEFEEHKTKYDGQLTLYKIAMSRVFKIPKEQIATELYDLY